MKVRDDKGNTYELRESNQDYRKFGNWYVVDGKKFAFVRKGKKALVFYEGNLFTLEIYHESASKEEDTQGTSPLTGRVTSIKFKEGEIVEEGDVVITVEAMKMEVSVHAYKKGKLKRIFVKVGDVVQQGDKLFEIG